MVSEFNFAAVVVVALISFHGVGGGGCGGCGCGGTILTKSILQIN
jgi:hypothetical protein